MENLVDKVNHPGTGPDGEVFDTIHAIMHLFRAQQFRILRDGAAGLELSHMESKALAYFARNPGATQRDLVLHSGRDKAQVTRLVAALREKGLLEAQADALDRRSTRLRLSSAGEAALEATQREAGLLAARALSGLDAEERTRLAGLLARIESSLRAG